MQAEQGSGWAATSHVQSCAGRDLHSTRYRLGACRMSKRYSLVLAEISASPGIGWELVR